MRLLFLFVLFLSCNTTDKITPEMEEKEMPQTTFSYLALGDSYTIGESVEVEERFPMQLAAQLRADSIQMEKPYIIATTGWTTDELQAGIDSEKIDQKYDLVSLLIGVNNQYRGYSKPVYEVEFEFLLQQAISFADGQKDRVFVVSIPDYAYTPFGQKADSEAISSGVAAFNEINKKITEKYTVAYYNITPISQKGIENPSLVASDDLHPSGAQYQLWVDSFYEKVKAKLLAK
ncbi:MAG: SGNH/GDSL hydrolase family protein [Bacteroidota bacterium]